MIVWLNGPFGAGKTTLAGHLVPLLPDARLLDPEMVGYLLKALLPDRPVADFQDWVGWRRLVAATLDEVHAETGQTLVCPQALLDATESPPDALAAAVVAHLDRTSARRSAAG